MCAVYVTANRKTALIFEAVANHCKVAGVDEKDSNRVVYGARFNVMTAYGINQCNHLSALALKHVYKAKNVMKTSPSPLVSSELNNPSYR